MEPAHLFEKGPPYQEQIHDQQVKPQVYQNDGAQRIEDGTVGVQEGGKELGVLEQVWPAEVEPNQNGHLAQHHAYQPREGGVYAQ